MLTGNPQIHTFHLGKKCHGPVTFVLCMWGVQKRAYWIALMIYLWCKKKSRSIRPLVIEISSPKVASQPPENCRFCCSLQQIWGSQRGNCTNYSKICQFLRATLGLDISMTRARIDLLFFKPQVNHQGCPVSPFLDSLGAQYKSYRPCAKKGYKKRIDSRISCEHLIRDREL